MVPFHIHSNWSFGSQCKTAFLTSGKWGYYSAKCPQITEIGGLVIATISLSFISMKRYFSMQKNKNKNKITITVRKGIVFVSAWFCVLFYLNSFILHPPHPPSPVSGPFFLLVSGDVTNLNFHYALTEPTQLDSQPTMRFKLVTSTLSYKFQQQLIWPEFQCYLHS